MSQSSKFRRFIKPLIIVNSIFSTGLIEYFIDYNINMIGIVYALTFNIFFVSMSYLHAHTTFIYNNKNALLVNITQELYIYNCYGSYIFPIITGILRRKVKFLVLVIYSIFLYFCILQQPLSSRLSQKIKRFMLQAETCIRSMEQLNIPMNLSKSCWQQFYVILALIFTMLIVIVGEIRILITHGVDYWTVFVLFYVYRYHIIILFINDFSFMFWMG